MVVFRVWNFTCTRCQEEEALSSVEQNSLGAAAYMHTSGLNAYKFMYTLLVNAQFLNATVFFRKKPNLTCVVYSLMSDHSISAFNPTTAA